MSRGSDGRGGTPLDAVPASSGAQGLSSRSPPRFPEMSASVWKPGVSIRKMKEWNVEPRVDKQPHHALGNHHERQRQTDTLPLSPHGNEQHTLLAITGRSTSIRFNCVSELTLGLVILPWRGHAARAGTAGKVTAWRRGTNAAVASGDGAGVACRARGSAAPRAAPGVSYCHARGSGKETIRQGRM